MKSVITLSSFLFPIIILAQSANLQPHNYANYLVDRYEIKSGELSNDINTNVKPYSRETTTLFFEKLDSTSTLSLTAKDRNNFYYVFRDNNDYLKNHEPIESRKPFLKHFYKTPANFWELNEEHFKLRINPIINFHAGAQIGDTTPNMRFLNQRGIEVRGEIDDKVGFYASLTDNQAKFPEYYRQFVIARNAVPEAGFIKPFKNGIGYDYYQANGYITLNATKHINVQFGSDKNFIGNGQRSLLLSDEGMNYLFLKLNTKIWKLHYQNLFTELTREVGFGSPDTLRGKKYGTFHFLSMNVTKNLQIGLFEGIIFQRNKFFELQYLNPIIFYRSVEQNVGSSDNALIGLDAKYNFKNHFQVYTQLMLDELKFGEIKNNRGWWGNKFGYQFGFKYIDVANIQDLDLQVEYNRVRPFTYSHGNTDNNYTHYNQALAHPLGANFSELIAIGNYKPHKQLRLTGRISLIQQGLDTSSVSKGSNIFVSYHNRVGDFGYSLYSGAKVKTVNVEGRLVYSYKHNLDFYAMFVLRRQTSSFSLYNRSDKYVGIGVALNTEIFKRIGI